MPRKAEAASSGSARPAPSRSTPALPAQATAWAMVLLRVFVGVKLVEAGISRWGWMGTNRLEWQLNRWTTGPNPAALSSYINVLRQFILPHAAVYTYLLVCGEILVGTCLVLGFLTRAATLPALVLSMNTLLVTWNLGPEWQGINEAFLVMELAILLAGAGRRCGIDVVFARKNPQWPLW